MFHYTKIYLFISLITLFYDLNHVSCSTNRKLSHFTVDKLIFIKAEGPADTLLYVWNFDFRPAVAIYKFVGTNFTVNWDNFEEQKQHLSYIFGVAIFNIYEFNDQDDSGILHNDDDQIIKMPTEHFNWTVQGFLDDIPDNFIRYSLSADGYQYGNISKTGFINITIYTFGSDGHSVDLPHLLHTENSSQINLIIDNLETSFSKSRFAVELVTGGTNDKDTPVKLSAKKTLDDENTPGVFILDTLRFGYDNDTEHSGYLQWRPIVYTSSDKVVSNSTKTIEYDIVNVTDKPFNSTLDSNLLINAYKFYSPIGIAYAENVSFGWTGDGFYKRTNYSSWSFLVGVGSSPEPQFSMMVFLIIAIGLGLPTLIILGGIAFIIYRKGRTGN